LSSIVECVTLQKEKVDGRLSRERLIESEKPKMGAGVSPSFVRHGYRKKN